MGTDFENARLGAAVRRPQRRRSIENDVNICLAIQKLNDRRYNILEFLQVSSNYFDPLHGDHHRRLIQVICMFILCDYT